MNKLAKKTFLAGAGIIVLFLVPVFVHADDPNPPQTVPQLIELIKKLVGILSRIFWIAAIGFILWAAFVYLQAGGDTTKAKEAGDRLKYAVIAIAIALMAGVLPALIQDILSK